MAREKEIMDRLEAATLIARQAGEIILETARGHVTQKKDSSFLTAADTASQEAITQFLQREFPGEAIIAEEQDNPKLESGTTWIVDPLDGTANYVVGLPGYAVNIAYMEHGVIKLGIMYFPAQRVLVTAARGRGCFINSKRCVLKSEDTLRTMRLGLDIAHTVTPEVFEKIIYPLRSKSAYPRNEPGSQSILELLTGITGVYFTNNHAIWDAAPGALAVAEAGGCVFTPEGKSPLWDSVRMRPLFFAASKRLKEEILSILAV